MIPIPKIALVGRPNVGKSTLFNRICGRRKAITDSRPGSTRDRNYAQVDWQGGAFELVDTGGLLLGSHDPLLGPATEQAARAIGESDMVVMVVDARAGIMPDDRTIAKRLRKEGKPVVIAVNKVETDTTGWESEFAALGFERMHAISAEHGRGVGDLLDEVLKDLPRVEVVEEVEKPLRVALVGRPNVGKSSLLNRLLGTERSLVSPIPGTTRDSVDSLIERGGKKYLIVDTAGIRRARLLKEHVDHVSVVQSKHSIERSEVGILVLDAEDGLKEMDATIGGYLQDAGRGVVIAINKWDLAKEKKLQQRSFEQDVRDHLKFLAFAPIVPVSALTGKGITPMLDAVARVHAASRIRVTTGQLNRFLTEAMQSHLPKTATGNKAVKLLFATQIGVAPPTFALSLNHAVELHFSYKRYLENQLRAEFGFEGTPIVIKVRTRPH